MRLLRFVLYSIVYIIPQFAVLSCTRDRIEVFSETEEVLVSATATLPVLRTKMVYEDGYPDASGIKAGWKTGDTFLALEINGNTVTQVKFTATAPAEVKTSFTSSGAVAADSNTRWVAVLGKKASFGNAGIDCTYSGQDGSLKGLENYDYMVASATGENPDFDYSAGKHLTYLLRLVAPEGVGVVEFNTFSGVNEWAVNTDGTATPCVPDYRPKAVKTLSLAGETKEGEVIYLAVPAVDYSDAGLIVTAMNKAGTRSQGKVKSENLSVKGGKVGTFEFGSLMDRPLESDAINFQTKFKSSLIYVNNSSWQGIKDLYTFSNSPSWAPFNIGASAKPNSAEEVYGAYFAWGETEQRASYGPSSYRYAGKDASLGNLKSYIGDTDISLDLRIISGTKYDVARVKWGKAWRMPFLEEMMIFTGSNEDFSCSSGVDNETGTYFTTADVTEYKGVAVNGRTFSRFGITVFFPFAGRYFYTSSSDASAPSMLGKAGFYYCGVHNNIQGSSEAYRMQVRSNLVEFISQGCGNAFCVRPVLAMDTDEPPVVTASGRITDSSTGKGIAGVNVSDGFNCCVTDGDGYYIMTADNRARSINVTVPAAYEIPLTTTGMPAFYKPVDFSKSADAVVDFALTPRQSANSRFTVLAVSDAHIQQDSELAMFKEGPCKDIQQTIDKLESSGDAGSIIGIALGDQLWDNHSMRESVMKVYGGFKTASGTMPFFQVIGNHDHQYVEEGSDLDATAGWFKYFGPTDYSFDIGNAHIIVMDNIEFTGSYGSGSNGYTRINYREKITGEQLHWLRQDIANVQDKSNKTVLFCTHAPMYNPIGNSSAVKSLLRSFREAHMFTGHIHNLTNYNHKSFKTAGGKSVFEHNIQSLSGMWWLADLSPNGTPAGYGVYTFDSQGVVAEYNKVWKEDEGFQLRVYDGNGIYGGYSWGDLYQGKFVVRVWDGDDPDVLPEEQTWSLTFVHNGVSTPMTRLTSQITDKCAAGYIVKVLHSPYGTGGSATSCSWWTVDAPGGDPSAVSDWKIIARHTLPGGWTKEYNESSLATDYTGYALGSHFITNNNNN